MEYIGFGSSQNPIEATRRRRQIYLLVSTFSLALIIGSVAGETWVAGVKERSDIQAEDLAKDCPACLSDYQAIEGTEATPPLTFTDHNDFSFGLWEYRTHRLVNYEVEGKIYKFESVCYTKIEDEERMWNRQAYYSDDPDVKNAPTLNAQDFEDPAGLMVATLVFQLILFVWAILLAMGFSLFCCSGSTPQYVGASLQALTWILLVSAMAKFSSAKVAYIVCGLVDPDQAVKCGYGAGFKCAGVAIMFMLFACVLSFWAFSDVDSEVNRAATGGLADAAAVAVGVGAGAGSSDPAAAYKPNPSAFSDDAAKEPPQDGAASAPAESAGGVGSYQSL